jgi:hypothetical protein
MNLEAIQDFDPNHVCKTPDAIFTTHFHDETISVSVKLPFVPRLSSEAEFTAIEAQLHYAIEGVLAQLFTARAGVEL